MVAATPRIHAHFRKPTFHTYKKHIQILQHPSCPNRALAACHLRPSGPLPASQSLRRRTPPGPRRQCRPPAPAPRGARCPNSSGFRTEKRRIEATFSGTRTSRKRFGGAFCGSSTKRLLKKNQQGKRSKNPSFLLSEHRDSFLGAEKKRGGTWRTLGRSVLSNLLRENSWLQNRPVALMRSHDPSTFMILAENLVHSSEILKMTQGETNFNGPCKGSRLVVCGNPPNEGFKGCHAYH